MSDMTNHCIGDIVLSEDEKKRLSVFGKNFADGLQGMKTASEGFAEAFIKWVNSTPDEE